MRRQKWSNEVELYSCLFSGRIQIETKNAKFEVTGVVQGKALGQRVEEKVQRRSKATS